MSDVSTRARPRGLPAHPALDVLRVPHVTSPVDVALTAVLAVWAVVEAVLVPAPGLPGRLAFALAVTVPLVVRRRFPGTVMVVVAVALLTHAATSSADATFNPFPSLLVAAFTVASQVAGTWRAALLGTVPVAAMLGAHALGYFGDPGIEGAGVVFLCFFVGAAWTGGRVVRQRALAVATAHESSGRLASEAVAAERARIARELHDVVAHAVSVVVLQAGAAEQFLDKDTERARTHLALARRTAGEALTEMRHLLGVLHEDDVRYAPQPGLDRVPDLVAETAAAGHRTALDMERVDVPVPDGVALAVYRVVQEALTNVRKHAPGAPVRVAVGAVGDAVHVDVVNGPAGHEDPSVERGGHGLAGMQERVRVYGGRLETGPTPDGGWRVRAELPLGRP